jgi:uracil-DNA glycosylase family 4
MNLQILAPQPSCTRCDLHAGGIKNPGVPWRPLSVTPNATAVVLVLGMNPGFHEDVANSCWQGRSGKVMTESYVRGSLIHEHADIWLGNVARCYTPSGKAPTSRQYRACWMEHGTKDFLTIMRSYGAARVRAALCAGADPLAHLTRWVQGKAMKQADAFLKQGLSLTIEGVQFNLFSTFHPSAVLRDPDKIHSVSDHLAVLRSHLTGNRPTATSPRIVPANRLLLEAGQKDQP